MSIVPPEIPPADPAFYVFTDPATGSPLNDPSHSGLHSRINTAVENLNSRVSVVEGHVNDLWPEVQQARLAAHEWPVRGALNGADNNKLLMPILWNMTGRVVQFQAAKLTVFTPPVGQAIIVDIVTGTTIAGGVLNTGTMASILDAPMTIIPGEFTSGTVTQAGGGFAGTGVHAVNDFVVAVILQVGTTDPGADLTIQLNRLL